ncbi:potassium channel protein [candidate division KSB1 bacterium]|nr:potassium channel protein [candidate division KSB1 bacterium]NIR68878.1 potassium channel protein [candidate division KSB1 bacterium]NIS27246.1 potassium channel protein [candidate division KSB1 bacterium]NIT74131.1 potassium channel protein [candidate division KSB1 bacterium]NIU27980.1 potassium channel protein [candidate division KSB1 bacterium]
MLFVFFAGTIGYILIEGWAFTDALYMTVITLSTVGFREVGTLSAEGKVFTVCLIISGIGTVGYGIGNLAAFIIEGELRELFIKRKMERDIEKLKNHIIICGYGDEGRHASEELERSKVPFLIIEKDIELAEKLREEGVLVAQGDATQDEILLGAGVERAKGLITAVTEDSENVFVTLTARGFNSNLTIVARAAAEATMAKLIRAGADKVISSAEIGGRRMASVLLRPKVVNFLDIIMSDDELALRLEEIDIDEKSAFVGKSIRDLHIRGRTGTLVIGFQHEGQSIQINPPAETVINVGDVLIVMGNESQVEKLRRIANAKEEAF